MKEKTLICTSNNFLGALNHSLLLTCNTLTLSGEKLMGKKDTGTYPLHTILLCTINFKLNYFLILCKCKLC